MKRTSSNDHFAQVIVGLALTVGTIVIALLLVKLLLA